MYLYIKRLLNRLVSFWTLLTRTTRSIHSLSFHVSSLLKSNFSLVWNKLLLSASHTGFGAPNGPRRWGAPINGDWEGGRAKPVQGLRYYSGHGRLHYLRTNRNMAVGRITVWTSDWLTDGGELFDLTHFVWWCWHARDRTSWLSRVGSRSARNSTMARGGRVVWDQE